MIGTLSLSISNFVHTSTSHGNLWPIWTPPTRKLHSYRRHRAWLAKNLYLWCNRVSSPHLHHRALIILDTNKRVLSGLQGLTTMLQIIMSLVAAVARWNIAMRTSTASQSDLWYLVIAKRPSLSHNTWVITIQLYLCNQLQQAGGCSELWTSIVYRKL